MLVAWVGNGNYLLQKEIKISIFNAKKQKENVSYGILMLYISLQ